MMIKLSDNLSDKLEKFGVETPSWPSKEVITLFFQHYPDSHRFFTEQEMPEAIDYFREHAHQYKMDWALDKLHDYVEAQSAERTKAAQAGTLPKPDYTQPNPPVWHIDTSQHRPSSAVLAHQRQQQGIILQRELEALFPAGPTG